MDSQEAEGSRATTQTPFREWRLSTTAANQETLQLTTDELQNSLNLQCTFDAETVRTLAALSSPVAPLLLLLGVFCRDFGFAKPPLGTAPFFARIWL